MNSLIDQVLRASQHRFIGRLARDPELRFFESGNCVANTRLAVNKPGAKRDDGQDPDWFKVEIWGEKAQQFADACSKGSLVDVTGRVKSEAWTDRGTGEERTQLVIQVERWEVVPTAGQQQPKPAAPAVQRRPINPASEEDIPF